MSQFEKYHPILTPHYAFDWLTKARAIDVLHLYEAQTTVPVSMQTAATRINQTMREIFRDQKLVWGVTDRQTDEFIGQAGFDPIDTSDQTATLRLDVFPAFDQRLALTELYQRLLTFGTAELKLTTLTVQLAQAGGPADQVLTALGFTTTDQRAYRYQV